MSTTVLPTSAPKPRKRGQRALDAAVRRFLKLPSATSHVAVSHDVPIPTRDGAVLLADHFAPVGEAVGTVLVRGPYGFNSLNAPLYGGLFASYGYHVVLARCRGTFGSGGDFEPMVRESEDAADTVAWLRDQPWFGGRFATFGASYMGFTQWALLMDPPPELAAAVIQVGPHDFSQAAYSGGAFNLNDFLGWSDVVTHQEQDSFLRSQLRMARSARRQAGAMSTLPVAAGSDGLCDGRATWYRGWASQRDLGDPLWSAMRLQAALDRVTVPVLLQTGWQDLFFPQTLAQYEHLHRRGLDVALTVGPWTHLGSLTAGGSRLVSEALDWLSEHLAGAGPRRRPAPVRVFVTGAKEWRDLASWPPATTERVLHLQPDAVLGDQPAPADSAPVAFTYDPADPTPTVGGRLLAPSFGGYKDDSVLATRADTVSFTSEPLDEPLEVIGVPVVELAHASDNPHVDLFVRLSEVTAHGRSRNVSDGFLRLDPAGGDGVVRLDLDAVAHRFAAGHRLRLLIAGGSFPRWERNLGTDEDPATSTAMRASHRTIDLTRSRVTLPVRG
ncbi:CocE/NonD family hydrolase [Frankia sp. AgB1.9]|uniref:CocE/NonD family hydrolase n=1 Tax=unclassified Frankia TaxID=2632575 RepID=UPI0019321D87|nr:MULTISPECIES: CocE/NonD family hydrolase [unclassified Frankia]MBL7487672.1 CocE/NonD family hydrolase [Frankia sp. AgW1.1]MBL7550050.1 CocE/NonD family hydrolase [Frankia sp. AgB1.9]MBL7621755.1 CocE/NonD family hydrolase [Frankia sp. AgB1.8]